jgi:hypothetical protein
MGFLCCCLLEQSMSRRFYFMGSTKTDRLQILTLFFFCAAVGRFVMCSARSFTVLGSEPVIHT